MINDWRASDTTAMEYFVAEDELWSRRYRFC
jgi:hypothetical protein